MIRMCCKFFSECLGRDAEVTVLLPADAAKGAAERYPTLYLLHGLTDSADSWLNRTALERYADSHRMAIVLPNASRSFYCDMAYGDAYYTHISREVPDFCEAVFPVTREPRFRYIAGNSMGAYGACKIALKEPDRFSKVGLFSGVLDIQHMVTNAPMFQRDWLLCFGGNEVPDGENLLKLLPKADVLPEIYHYCGTEDFLAEGNRTFCNLCASLHVPLTSVWEEGGVHEWHFWEKQLPALLNWLDPVEDERGESLLEDRLFSAG
ncbi:MAG: esterase family protein [Oscillospiraceae bacterium]|nr:esterase family protein [Oscillospiraceae bacterium]